MSDASVSLPTAEELNAAAEAALSLCNTFERLGHVGRALRKIHGLAVYQAELEKSVAALEAAKGRLVPEVNRWHADVTGFRNKVRAEIEQANADHAALLESHAAAHDAAVAKGRAEIAVLDAEKNKLETALADARAKFRGLAEIVKE